MNNSVSIATKPLVYSTFRFLNHKAWNALAEYIDNSIQSFIDHEDELRVLNSNGKVTVRINFDLDNDTITIWDNAYGIEEHNFQRAFELANIPLDASGLNEFGMGMKVSSIWFSDLWSVETSAYGECNTKKVVFDLKEVVDNERLSLDVEEKPSDSTQHYTLITLKKLAKNNKPGGRTLGAIKKHLTSIYIKFIREGVLDLYFNDERLEPAEVKPLVAPYHKTPNGEPIEWIKEVSFSAPKFENGVNCGNYVVSGFIGILETMSTSTENGILLFRRGRVIGSSYDEKFRPKALCGEEGSPRYKRIYGELELDGFSVSFNKSSFLIDEDFEVFIDLIKEELTADESCNFISQAQNYRKPITTTEKKKIASNLVKNIATGFTKPITVENYSAQDVESKYNEITTTLVVSEPHIPMEEQNVTPEIILPPTEVPLKIYGKQYSLIIGTEYVAHLNGLYTLERKDDKYIANLNLKNPYFERFNKAFSTDDELKPIASFIQTMVAAEMALIQNGDYATGKHFRDKFNEFFGQF